MTFLRRIFSGVAVSCPFFIFGSAASQYTGLPARPPVCCLSVSSSYLLEKFSVTILTSTIVWEYHRVFYNYTGPKNDQYHTQTF